MKIFFLMLFISLPSIAEEALDKRYKCIVRGVFTEENYDYLFGEFADTEEKAIESAMNICTDQGYPYCQLIGCR